MDIEEARRRVAAEEAELVKLEADVGALAQQHPGPVLMTIISALVERVCASQGSTFYTHNKLRFYRDIIAALSRKGIT